MLKGEKINPLILVLILWSSYFQDIRGLQCYECEYGYLEGTRTEFGEPECKIGAQVPDAFLKECLSPNSEPTSSNVTACVTIVVEGGLGGSRLGKVVRSCYVVAEQTPNNKLLVLGPLSKSQISGVWNSEWDDSFSQFVVSKGLPVRAQVTACRCVDDKCNDGNDACAALSSSGTSAKILFILVVIMGVGYAGIGVWRKEM